jgi:hypothetical protein
LSFVFTPIFSQSPACANFSGVFISDSLEQNFPEYYICSGKNIYLKSLNNPVGASYQWKKNGVNISGKTIQKINITAEGIYSLTMTVGACTATSSGIIVRQAVSGGYNPYQISSNNITQACIGDSILLKVSKGIGVNYQWKKNNINIVGATNSSSYKAISSGNYTLVATQGTCSFTSSTVLLNFSNMANPNITTNKNVVCENRKTLIKASNINATHTLQWFKDGVEINGANKDNLEVSQTGNYTLQSTKGSCYGNSNALDIVVTNLNLPAPQIEKFYVNDFETCGNNIVKLKVKDYNDTTLVWLKNGNIITGQTGTTLIARESGNYAVRYSGNEICFSQSDIVPVKITNIATMNFAGNSFTIPSGQLTKINYTVNGTSPFIFNVNNTSNTLILDPFANPISYTPTSTTTYSATTIANACGVGTFSNPAIITVGTCSPVTQITSISATSVTVCIGGTTTINVSANGASYQWQKDGVDISGATSNSLNITNFNYSDIGHYKLKVTGTCGTITSENIKVNANYGDVVFAKLDYPAYTNSDILLTAFSGSSFGNASNAYTWAGPNGFSSSLQNPIIPNGTAINSGTYTVTATNAGGCVNYALLKVTVTSAPITLGNLGTTSFCPNGTLLVPFTTTLLPGTTFKVYLSDQNGSFQYPTQIGMGMISPIEVTFPQNLIAGTKYRIKIISTNPIATSTLSSFLSTDGQNLSISVKNLIGRELYFSLNVCEGSALTGIISSDQQGVSYEWKKDEMVQTTNASLKMISTGDYTASIQKSGCNKVSKVFNVSFGPTIFHYSYQTGSKYQCAGGSILFQETYFSDSVSYQWKRDGIAILGQIRDTLIASQTGNYSVALFDKCPVINDSDGREIIFSNVIENDPLFLRRSPLKITLCGNSTYSVLYGSNSNTDNPLALYSFQWKKDGQNIAGETNSSLNINSKGIYSLALIQGGCTAVSLGIPVIKVDTFQLELKVREDYASEICQGTKTLLTSNTPEGMTIAFNKDGVTLFQLNGSEAFVQETGKYTINGSSPECVVLASDTLKITVGDKIKPILNGESRFLCNGREAYLGTYIFNGPNNLTYQWFKDGVPIPFKTNFGMFISEPGSYKVRATSGSCSGFSDSVRIVVSNNLPKPEILIDRNDISRYTSKILLCENSVITLSSHLYSFNFLNINLTSYDTLIWKKNGRRIGQVSNYEDFLVTQPGTYTVVGKQGTCESESDPVEIKIGEPITANITGSTSIYPGQSAKLNLNFTGGNAWFYQTSDVPIGQTTSLSPFTKNVKPTSTQSYSITSVASNCGVGTVTGNATVTVLPCPADKTFSVNSGNWNVPATWTCGQIPSPIHDAVIEKEHTVSLPNSYQGETKKLDLKGTLKQGVGSGVRVY